MEYSGASLLVPGRRRLSVSRYYYYVLRGLVLLSGQASDIGVVCHELVGKVCASRLEK